jgi:protein AFG1
VTQIEQGSSSLRVIVSIMCYTLSLTISYLSLLVSEKRILEFLGRKLEVPRAAGKLALFSFKDLCARPLSAADYLELCTHFDTLFIKDIPQMSIQKRSEARRFITMVDTLYDHKVKVICTSEVDPGELFKAQPMNIGDSKEFQDLMDDLDIEAVNKK